MGRKMGGKVRGEWAVFLDLQWLRFGSFLAARDSRMRDCDIWLGCLCRNVNLSIEGESWVLAAGRRTGLLPGTFIRPWPGPNRTEDASKLWHIVSGQGGKQCLPLTDATRIIIDSKPAPDRITWPAMLNLPWRHFQIETSSASLRRNLLKAIPTYYTIDKRHRRIIAV